MSDDLNQVETWVGELIARLEPAGRRKLARQVATGLRRDNAARIAAQRDPEGAAFAPRKRKAGPALRARKGRIRKRAAQLKTGPMFRKLRSGRYLLKQSSAEFAATGFAAGAAARIARVHQLGLSDRVVRIKGARVVKYDQRILLGFPDADRQRLLDLVLAHLDV